MSSVAAALVPEAVQGGEVAVTVLSALNVGGVIIGEGKDNLGTVDGFNLSRSSLGATALLVQALSVTAALSSGYTHLACINHDFYFILEQEYY